MSRVRGQTESIGAVLTVAVVVVTVSIAGAAVFDANSPTSHPNVEIRAAANGTNITIEHRAGEPLERDEFELILGSSNARLAGSTGVPVEAMGQSDGDDLFEPGETWRFETGSNVSADETVSLVFDGERKVLLQDTGVEQRTTVATPQPATTATTTSSTSTTTSTTTGSTTKTSTATTTTQTNQPPTADAGGPYTVSSKGSITLDGSASKDPDGSIQSYSWQILTTSGKNGKTVGSLSNASTATPTYAAENGKKGQVTVRLNVTDDDGATATDTATITVKK